MVHDSLHGQARGLQAPSFERAAAGTALRVLYSAGWRAPLGAVTWDEAGDHREGSDKVLGRALSARTRLLE